MLPKQISHPHIHPLFCFPAAQERTKSFGKISPGPIYTLQDSIGPQRLSTKAGAPARGFGSCDRWYTQKLAARFGNTPAPGAYNV